MVKCRAKIIIVAHDAGGAEILSSWIKRNNVSDFKLVLEGPAVAIFERKLGQLKNRCAEKVIQNGSGENSWVLTGSGWQSDLEWNAIRIAKKRNIRVVTYLDHWSNYKERFTRHDTEYLPDEIWVGDHYAFRIAETTFPTSTVTLVPNPFFADFQEVQNQKVSSSVGDQVRILYVCEPVSEHTEKRHGNKRYWGYTEFEALDYFFKNIEKIVGEKSISHITIRPHPSENLDKYSYLDTKKNELPSIRRSHHKILIDEIAEHDWVVGCESIALVVAILMSKEVFSCIPPNGKECVLPHQEIKHFRNLVEL